MCNVCVANAFFSHKGIYEIFDIIPKEKLFLKRDKYC